MEHSAAIRCNLTSNLTGNSSSSLQPITQPSVPLPDIYQEYYKFAFGSAIYMVIVSFTTIVANGLLLVVFFLDPFKVFRNATTYFLIGLSLVDIITATTQQPMDITCFIMEYLEHPDTNSTCTPLVEVIQTISLASWNASFFIVLAFTITQYMAVISPLNYALKVTKTRVMLAVISIYAYAIFFSLLSVMGVPRDIHYKIDHICHSFIVIYLTIIFYILLHIAFKKKMAASKSLSDIELRNDHRQTALERKFIIVNFLLIAILFLCSQPSVILWSIDLFGNVFDDPSSPRVLISFLMVENVLYLKFLLDPFVYACRIPKYRQALKIVLRCHREEAETKSTLSDRVVAQMRKSRETVVTLDFKSIPPE